jgi:Trypsin-co-occurring domain 2
MPEDLDRVSLKSAVAALRHQLKEAAEQAAGLDPKEPRFRVEKVELELTVAAEGTVEGGTEVGWWIFKANAKLGAKDAVTHKVKLTLNIDDLLVGSRR